MTPEQKRELRDALRAVDHHFQRQLNADVPGQLANNSLGERWQEVETWRAVLKAIKTLDDIYESHQRMRGSMEQAVETLEGKR